MRNQGGLSRLGKPLTSNLFEFRIVSNTPRCPRATVVQPLDGSNRCSLMIVEFDDQGLCFDRGWRAKVEAALAALRACQPIILVFVHGWRHNADQIDDNLRSFEGLLTHTAAAEGDGGRPVLGVFVAWRGLSRKGNDLWEMSSFWDRQQAAERVAHGSARELLGRLKVFRNTEGAAKLIIIGHSFGGLIVYTAIAQSLIEAAASQQHVTPSYGDLVLLVNPAFTAVSYLPIHEIVCSGKTFTNIQPPVFVSVTADNDEATGMAFPLANASRKLTEATRGALEAETLIRTMGHVRALLTHRLSVPEKNAPATEQAGSTRERFSRLTQQAQQDSFGPVTVSRLIVSHPESPFWVASASKQVINGHNGIFTEPFEAFVRKLVEAHLQ